MNIDGKIILEWAAGTTFTLLLSGNIFFVSRLVQEIDDTKQAVMNLHEQVQILDARISHKARGEDAYNPDWDESLEYSIPVGWQEPPLGF